MNSTYITKKERLLDLYFIFIINLLPILQTTGLLPPIAIKIGINAIGIVLAFPLFLHSFSKTNEQLKKKSFYWFTVITLLYIVYTFSRSMLSQGFMATFTNFRYSFCNIIIFYFACHYVYSISRYRLFNILKWLFILTIIESILYIGHTMGILHFYSGHMLNIENSNLIRSYMGFPPLAIPVYGIALIIYIVTKNKKYLAYTVFLALTVFLSYTRSSLAIMLLLTVLIPLLLNMKRVIGLGRIFKSVCIATIIIIGVFLVFPSSMQYWITKFNNTINSELKEDQGTYAFRERLIEDALYQNRHGTELIGLGYVRDSAKGEYSLVQGGDTYVAPVLYCEGYIGLLLRISIIAIIFLSNLKQTPSLKKRMEICANILIISLILIEIPNYIQTSLFSKFSGIPLFLIIVERFYSFRYPKRQIKTNKKAIYL